jgi:signal transduction histidine kinase
VTDAQRQDLDRLRRANQHLSGLVADVLNFARLEAGQVEYHCEALALGPLLADLEALVAPQLEARGLAHDLADARGTEATAPGAASPVVWADPEKVRQVLLNLLTNAGKFTEPGGSVTLGHEHDPVDGVVRIHVRDTGRGIAPDQQARVFEPFVQLDRPRTHASQQGVGLGLAISRDLARGMGGELTVASTPGVGSTFTLTLPAA